MTTDYLLKKWMLQQSMKLKSHSNVTCDYRSTQKYQIKEPFKCNICEYSCSQERNMNRHVASVHDEKKPEFC